MFVELTDPSNPSKVKFTVGNFYRPPHTNVAQLQSFNRHFANKLESMNTRDTTFVCGDYNINLLSVNSDEHSSSFLNGILSSGFLPAITLPTRPSNNGTLIDNVFVNQQAEFNFSGILENEISDHQAVVVNTKLILPHTKTRYITIYSNREEAKNNFKNYISSKNIFDKLNKNLTNNPNENYNILEEEISKSLEIHMNKKTVKFNRRKHKRDPWITFGILHSINRKNSLYGDIEDEYHIVLICENFRDVRLKYIKPYYHNRPSMFKFVEFMNTTNKRDRFRLMLFLKIVFNLYGETL